MAFKEKEIKKSCVLLFLAMFINQVTFINARNSDCRGKAFYCLNSTHFMICLDLGDGVSTTVEDFVIPCPPPTMCLETNDFECEYHTTTTLKSILQSEGPVTELNSQTWRGDSDYTTFLPFLYNKEDSVKSEKYYDILDNPLTTRKTISETSTHQESTTETKINEEINTERITFTPEEKSTLPPTFYTITEDVTISSQQVKVVNNAVSDGYDHNFDTVSSNTVSESTTQSTTQYDETQPTTGYIDENNSSNNIIITKEEPPILRFYTYKEEATTYAPLNFEFWADGNTLTTNFASDKIITTVQESKHEEIKRTTNSEITALTTEIEEYLITYSDYVDALSPITELKEAGEMPNEVTSIKNTNYEITTEFNNYINNSKFDTTTPLITPQQDNIIVKEVLVTNISDASNLLDYINSNSITKVPQEDTTTNYGKTEDTEINYSNIIDTNINYPTTTDVHEYINTIVSTTEQNIINEEYKAKYFRKLTTTIDKSSTEKKKYLNTYSDYVDTLSPITELKEAGEMPNEVTIIKNTNYEITTEFNNNINNFKFDTTTPLITPQRDNMIDKVVLVTNISDSSNLQDYINNNSITKVPEEDTTTNYGKTEETLINYSSIIDTDKNYPTTTDVHEYINTIVSTTEQNIMNEEYEAKYFPKFTTTIDESAIKYMTTPYVSQIFNSDINQITYTNKENRHHSSRFSPKANINVVLKNTQDITTSTDVSHLDLNVNEMSFQTDKKYSEMQQTTSKVPVTGNIMQDNTTPYYYKGTIPYVEQKSLFSIENVTVLNDIVSSSTKDDFIEINLESTHPLDYQISTDSSMLSPIETPSVIKENFSALDNVIQFKTNGTVLTERYNDQSTKQSNYKNQGKTNAKFYTTPTPSYGPTGSSPAYDYKTNIKITLPDFMHPKTTSTELKTDLKTKDTYIKENTISEQRNTHVHTFPNEFTTSPWLNNPESNNKQYEVTKEMNVTYHDKSPDTASTTPSIFDLNNLEKVTIDDKNNLQKTVKEPSSEMKSTLSISQGRASIYNLLTSVNDKFITSNVNATESYAPSNFQDNEITESVNYIHESITTNAANNDDIHSSFVGTTYPMVNTLPDKILDITTETIQKLTTGVLPVPIIAIINGTKTVVIYSEASKIEGAGYTNKLPAMEVNNTNATRNTTVLVRHSLKTQNLSQLSSEVPVISNASYINNVEKIKSPPIALANNITSDRHETIGEKQSVLPNVQDKKETVSVQITQPCNITTPDTTNNNKISHTITPEILNFTCLNRYSGKYPDKNNCQTFYMCIGTMSPIVGQCPQNSVFSDILNQCTRNLSHCVRNNEFQCVSTGRFSDLWSRDTYYICVRHKSKFVRFKLRCQKGYFLNKTSITCVEDPVIEKQSFTLESYSTSSSSSSADSKSGQIENKTTDVEFKCEKEGVFPDPNHCRKYYVCKKMSKSKIRLKKKKCDSDEVFNDKKKKCVDEDSYECET